MYTTIISKKKEKRKESMNLNEKKKYTGGFGGRKGKGEMQLCRKFKIIHFISHFQRDKINNTFTIFITFVIY